MTTSPETTARLSVTCPDKPGIVSAVTTFLYHHGVNITELDQHSSDAYGGKFFLRLEFQTPTLDVTGDALVRAFGEVVGKPYAMDWRISFAATRPRMAVLVSKHDHALMELLWRVQRGELRVEIPMVISNHADLRAAVESFGVRPIASVTPRTRTSPRDLKPTGDRRVGQVTALSIVRLPPSL